MAGIGLTDYVTPKNAAFTGIVEANQVMSQAAGGGKLGVDHDATNAGLIVTPVAGNPSSPANGDIWYNLTTGKLMAREAGVSAELIGGGASQLSDLSDVDSAAQTNGYVIKSTGGNYVGAVPEFPDGIFGINNSADATKQLWIDASAISAGFLRKLAMANQNIDLTPNTGTFSAAAHAARHTDGSDDVQDATAAQKGLATAAQITKLDGIEALADVTDATNVNAAGAVMETDAAGGDLGGTYPNPTVDDGADSTAIHNNVSAEISLITEKVTPVNADLIVIEDSAASNAKKRVQVGNLPGGGVTDHGALTGLGDDDHTQYVLHTIADAIGDMLYADSTSTFAKLAAGTDLYRLRAKGSGVAPVWEADDIGVSVYHSVDQAVGATSWGTLAFDTERWDTDTIHDTVTNNSRLTCKTAGIYVISFNCLTDATGSVQWATRIMLNGATHLGGNNKSMPDHYMHIARIYKFAVNDYVEAHMYNGAAVSRNARVAANHSPEFAMQLIART